MPAIGRRGWALAVVLAIIAAILFLPLRLALALADTSMTAQQASGTIWSGRLEDARIGALGLGTLDVGLDPIALLTGRAALDFARIDAAAPPLSGRIGAGLGGRFVERLTGTLPGGMIGELPVEQLTLDAVSVRFSGSDCAEASGRVRLTLATQIAGITLRNGMAGTARCDGDVLLLPLTGDSGVERLTLRLSGDGAYIAALSVGGGAELLRYRGRF
jgi:general secretion pathway protein N